MSMNADSKWSTPFLVAAFLALGATPDGEFVGCRVVEIVPGAEWDIIPTQGSGAGIFSRCSWQVTNYAPVGSTAAVTFGVSTSPTTYSAPGDLGPAVRVTAAGAIPSGSVVQVRATRASAS